MAGTVLTRRNLFKYSSILGALGLVELRNPDKVILGARRLAAAQQLDVLTFSLTRPDDMLDLRFEAINLRLDGPPPRLAQINQGQAAYVIVHFPPQSIGEEAFVDDDSLKAGSGLPDPPIAARLSQPTRLAYLVPPSLTSIPFDRDTLLGWHAFDPSLVPVSRQDGTTTPALRAPLRTETAIEAPWNVILSPDVPVTWSHSSEPVTRGDRVELWHTRFGTDPNGPFVLGKTVRAVWTPGFNRSNPPQPGVDQPFRTSLTPNQRWQLVRLTSDYKIPAYDPEPIHVDNLMLTPLGAFLKVRGDWSPPSDSSQNLGVTHWDHLMTMGRDQRVKVVERGVLFPFGHAASLVTITEREFRPVRGISQASEAGAVLRQRQFIVVKQPVKSYGNLRSLPFRSIELRTVVTPDLDLPASPIPGTSGPSFWPQVRGTDFLFHVTGRDWEGQPCDFTAPLVFVGAPGDAATISKVKLNYDQGPEARRKRPMQGQRIALTSSSPSGSENSTLDVKTIRFAAVGTGAQFTPKLASAEVRLNAVEEILGSGLGAKPIEYHPAYLANGYAGPNASAEMFARLQVAVALDFGAADAGDRSGGVVTPNMQIVGLSRKIGPVGGDPSAAPAGQVSSASAPAKFDPKSFFKDAAILGGISLADIIDPQALTGFDQAPQIVQSPDDPTSAQRTDRTLQVIVGGTSTTTFKFKIENTISTKPLRPDPLGIFVPGDKASLVVNVTLKKSLSGGVSEVVGVLSDFKLVMLGTNRKFLVVGFKKLKIVLKSGSPPSVDPDVESVEFDGNLKFVQSIQNYLSPKGNNQSSSGGGKFAPIINKKGIGLKYSYTLPPILIGVVSLQNVTLSSALGIPWTGKAITMEFALGRRDAPFVVTYAIWGGGGFFRIKLGQELPATKVKIGVEALEASLEFGFHVGLSLVGGKVSGTVSLMAGIYYKIGEVPGCTGKGAALTGFIRGSGNIKAFGISVSLVLYAGLLYDVSKNEIWAQVSVTVSVELAFFSQSVYVRFDWRLQGSGPTAGPPCMSSSALFGELAGLTAGADARAFQAAAPAPITFEDILSETAWRTEYVTAFAPAAFAGAR